MFVISPVFKSKSVFKKRVHNLKMFRTIMPTDVSTNVHNNSSNATSPEQSEYQKSSEHEDDSLFVFPPRHKIAKVQSSNLPQHDRYVLKPSHLSLQNRFDSLTDHTYAMCSDEMHTDSSENAVKKVKIPPIFLHNVNNHQAIIADIKKVVKREFTTALRGSSLKINLEDVDDFRNLTRFYDDSNVKYHTFQTPQDRKLEVVLRNVPLSLSEEEIKTELLDSGFPVIKVVRLLNKNKSFIPLCSVSLENNEKGLDIFKLEKLYHSIIQVEAKRKNKDIPQCVRCQRFGHTKNFCRLDPRCVRCTGQHLYSDCPLAKTADPECVNCGEKHTANYKGCKHYQGLKNKEQKSTYGKNMQRPSINVANDPVVATQPENSPDVPSSSASPGGRSYAAITKGNTQKQSPSVPHQASGPESIPSSQGLPLDLDGLIMKLVQSVVPVIKEFLSNFLTSMLAHASA